MRDTSPEMEARFHAMLMARSSVERLEMSCAMFDDARRIVEASIRATNPAIDEVSLRQAVFLRFYGHEFGPEQRERILARIAAAWQRAQERASAKTDAPDRWT